MMRRGVWLWLVLVLCFGFGVYELKLKVQGLEQRLAKANHDILEQEEAIHVLKAEWSYLNQPDRIDALARKYLGMVPLTGGQYATLEELAGRNDAPIADGSLLPLPPTPPVMRPRPPRGTRVSLAKELP